MRQITISYANKSVEVDIDAIHKIVIEKPRKSGFQFEVVLYNVDKTRSADFQVISRTEGLEVANYILNNLVNDGAKYFNGVEN